MARRVPITIELYTHEIQILSEPAQFPAWEKEIQIACKISDCWGLVSGEEVILSDPGYQHLLMLKPEETNSDHWYQQDEYEAQQTAIQYAVRIVTESVSEAIRAQVSHEKPPLVLPKEIFDYLKTHFSPPPGCARSLITALNQMERLAWEPSMTVTSFTEQLHARRTAVQNAGGTYDDNHMVAKISRSLPKQFDECLHRLLDTVAETLNLECFIAALCSYEARSTGEEEEP